MIGGSPDDPALAKMVAKFRYPAACPLFSMLEPRMDARGVAGMHAGRWHLPPLLLPSKRMLTALPATTEV